MAAPKFATVGACEFVFHSRKTLPFTLGVEQISREMKEAYSDEVVRMILGGLRTSI